MRLMTEYPEGAMQSQEELEAVMATLKGSVDVVEIYGVCGIGPGSILDVYQINRHDSIHMQDVSTWMRSEPEWTPFLGPGGDCLQKFSLKDRNIIKNDYNDNFMFKDRALAEKYLVYARVHTEQLVRRGVM